MNERLRKTLWAWPVITAATIGICFLTQITAKLFGLELPDQQNVEVVRQYILHAFDTPRHFFVCAFLIIQVVVLLPIVEEIIFRWLLVRLPIRIATKKRLSEPPPALCWTLVVVSSALFSAAHYIAQPFPDAAFIALFFFGLAQCWLYSKTDRLWCSVLNHCLFNISNLVLMFLLPQ